MKNCIICKECVYSYELGSGSNCPSSIIKEYGLPLHCIVDGFDAMRTVHENESCEKGVKRLTDLYN